MQSSTRSSMVNSKPSSSSSSFSSSYSFSFSKQIKHYLIIFLTLLLISLLFLTQSFKTNPKFTTTTLKRLHTIQNRENSLAHHHDVWFRVIAKAFKPRKMIRIGLVNMVADKELHALPNTKIVTIKLSPMVETQQWEELFPKWIDEKKKWGAPKCPKIPLAESYGDVDVVVARVPCSNVTEKEGFRNVLRLQVNMVVAKITVESGWVSGFDLPIKKVYVVFVGQCRPMLELFRCDDLIMQHGKYLVYKPDITKLKQKLLMPVGACQIATPYSQTDKEPWRYYMSQKHDNTTQRHHRPRYAYVTVLHSSDAYVCGAISLAQSIRLTNSNKDLLLLADESITSNSTRALRLSGWKIRRIKRVRNPFSHSGSYNEWNYSKLRVWQLVDYDKVIFINANFLVLNNIDHLFTYPQLSACPNSKVGFNSGLMVVEPSACLFEDLMRKSFKLEFNNGKDQDFLNKAFTWWHRLPSKLNHLKSFESGKHEVHNDIYALHYLGLKPWMCYRDYDCNWDKLDHHVFASDEAHRRWWNVYDAMPMKLKPFCRLTKEMDWNFRNWRQRAMIANLSDGHWSIHVKDPRQYHYVD